MIFLVSVTAYYMDYGVMGLESDTLERKFKMFLINHNPLGTGIKTSKFIDEATLQQKIKQGLPDWAQNQIKQDIAKLNKTTSEEISHFLDTNKNKFMARFQIKNGKVKVTADDTIAKPNVTLREARDILYDAIAYLAKKRLIPDTDFILCLADFVLTSGEISIPLFTFAKDLNSAREKDLILLPDYMNMRSNLKMRKEIKEGKASYPWSTKRTCVLWRGSFYDSTGFRNTLVKFSKSHPKEVDAAFVDNMIATVEGHEAPNYQLSLTEHLLYKYLITIDGNRCAWERFVWQLFSNSLIMKHATSQVQWFYAAIKPFQHYLPVTDETDLLKKMAWAEEHPEEVQSMIKNANEFAENNLTLEDMYLYLSVLLTEYSKLIDNSENKG